MLASLKRPTKADGFGAKPDRITSALQDSESLAREIEAAAKIEASRPEAHCGVTEDESIGTFEVELMDGWCKP